LIAAEVDSTPFVFQPDELLRLGCLCLASASGCSDELYIVPCQSFGYRFLIGGFRLTHDFSLHYVAGVVTSGRFHHQIPLVRILFVYGIPLECGTVAASAGARFPYFAVAFP
jgi:hypothetical protein